MSGKGQKKSVSFSLKIIILPVLNQKKNLKMIDVSPTYQGQTKIPGPISTRHCILRTSFLTNLLNAYTQISSLCAQETLVKGQHTFVNSELSLRNNLSKNLKLKI